MVPPVSRPLSAPFLYAPYMPRCLRRHLPACHLCRYGREAAEVEQLRRLTQEEVTVFYRVGRASLLRPFLRYTLFSILVLGRGTEWCYGGRPCRARWEQPRQFPPRRKPTGNA